MAQTSPTLRAASVAALSRTLPQQPELLKQYAAQLTGMAAQDAWWEVQAQLLVLCGAMLPAMPDDETLLTIAGTCLHANALVAVRKVGLWALAGCCPPTVLPAYVDALLSLPAADRAALLELDDQPVALAPGVASANLALAPLASVSGFAAAAVAKQLC